MRMIQITYRVWHKPCWQTPSMHACMLSLCRLLMWVVPLAQYLFGPPIQRSWLRLMSPWCPKVCASHTLWCFMLQLAVKSHMYTTTLSLVLGVICVLAALCAHWLHCVHVPGCIHVVLPAWRIVCAMLAICIYAYTHAVPLPAQSYALCFTQVHLRVQMG